MHYKILFLTKKKPSMSEIKKAMEPYRWDDEDEDENCKKAFTHDYFDIGGRYAGSIIGIIPESIKRIIGEDVYISPDDLFGIFTCNIRDALLERAKVHYDWRIENVVEIELLRYLLPNPQPMKIICDGSPLEYVSDDSEMACWGIVKSDGSAVTKEHWDGKDWIDTEEQFEDEYKTIMAEARKNNEYLTILDIHN